MGPKKNFLGVVYGMTNLIYPDKPLVMVEGIKGKQLHIPNIFLYFMLQE